MLALAILFGAATTAYSIVWMVHVHYVVDLGTNLRWLASHEAEVHDVASQSSAAGQVGRALIAQVQSKAAAAGVRAR